MPDISSAPAIGSPSGLYPQPPSQQGALSSNPGQILDLMRSLTQNEMLQRELKARAAVGGAYQGALNPDLTLDPQKFRAGLANNPDAMWMAPQATQEAQTLANQQFANRVQQNQVLSQLFGALPPNPTDEELRHFRVTATRILGPQAAPLIETWWDAVQSAPNRAKALGIARSSGMSPAEQSQRVGVIGPGGEQLTVPAATANIYPGAMPTSLTPDEAQSVTRLGQDKPIMGQYSQRVLPLQQAMRSINDMEAKYGKGFFGPGAEGRQDFQAFVQTLSPDFARWIGIDPTKLTNFAETRKYLVQAIQNRAASTGADTNEKLATTISGSPNVHVTDLALPDLVRTALAAQRAEQAQMQEAAKAGGPRYTDALSKWPQRNDIRAFALDLMPPDDRAKFVKSLTPAEKSRINTSLRSAYDAGVMDRPTSAAPAKAKTPPKPSVPGVQLGRRVDGSQGWFIPDPNRPGKHLEVMMPGLGQ